MLAVQQSGRDDIEVVVEDDRQEPDVAVQIADRMIQSEDVDVLTGIIFSNLAMAVVPSVVNQDVFYLSPNAGPSQLAGAGCHKNYFNVAWQNDNLHEAAGAYTNDAGYANAFILAPNYPAGQDALTGFKRLYQGALAGELYTQLGQTDYAAEIAQIRASGADSVYIFLPGGMGISFIKQYSDSGVSLPLVGPGFSFDQDILGAVGEAALGVRNTSQWSPDLDNEANRAFVESFQAEYGRLPSLYASQGFDTANLLISAMGKADVSDMDEFRAALEEADFVSTRGVGTALEDHADAYAAECSM
jgi:branched-chain amino acid transport system substrate-binding protein